MVLSVWNKKKEARIFVVVAKTVQSLKYTHLYIESVVVASHKFHVNTEPFCRLGILLSEMYVFVFCFVSRKSKRLYIYIYVHVPSKESVLGKVI